MKIYKIAAGIHGANCYIVVDKSSNSAMIVDPGGSPDEILEFIDRNNYNLEYIVLTHGHADHIGGVLDIEKALSIPIIAHEDEAELLGDANKNLTNQMFRKTIEIEPSILLKDGDKFKVGQLEVEVIHTPGHTEGGMCLKIGNDLISGDTLFKNSIGRADLYGGNPKLLLDSIRQKLFSLSDDVKVWPGHGPTTTIGEEKLYNPHVN